MLGRVIAAVVVVTVTVGATASAQDVKLPGIDFGRYHALVIGNNDYEFLPKLKTALVDAVAVAELLRLRYGFKVKLLVNATRLQILDALNAYRRDLTERDNLLIYYAGHGVLDQETDTGFWLPVDAKADSDSFWIPNSDLSRRLRGVSARHVLVVADSCYAGTLVREAAAALPTGAERTAWLERMNGLPSRTALVSGGLEPVMDGGGGNHSVFAKAFLEALRGNDDVLDGHALFRQVSRPVVLNAPNQTPRYSDIKSAGHEGGEFMFVPLNLSVAVTVKAVPAPRPDASAFELAFWESVKDSNDPAKFEAYLRRYTNGAFADLANLEIEAAKARIQQTALAVSPKAELAEAGQTIDADKATIRMRLREIAALEAARDALKKQIEEMTEEGRLAALALGEERQLSARAASQLQLLNRQVAQLRRQIAALNRALDAAEVKNTEQQVENTNLGARLNVALASKVQELARYRSEFFGRLREALGNRPDIQIVGDRFILQSEVLFLTGAAELEAGGQEQLRTLAGTVSEIAKVIPPDIDWVLMVEGHTDKRPIKSFRFPSNWELSTARATSVVKFLIENGVPANRLAAAGYGEFQPLDTNDDEVAYRRNRRIELKLTQPRG